MSLRRTTASCRAGGAVLLLCLSPVAAAAEDARTRVWHGTLYGGQWIVLDDVGSGHATERAWFVSGIASRVLVPALDTSWQPARWLIRGSSLEIEGQFGTHFGLQRHMETSLALVWRSRDVTLTPGGLRMNFAAAEGFSYALSRPTLEGDADEQEPRKFLNYLAFELELSHPSVPGVSLVPRLHHRSGIFGVIAPQGSGSDYLGIGVRISLE